MMARDQGAELFSIETPKGEIVVEDHGGGEAEISIDNYPVVYSGCVIRLDAEQISDLIAALEKVMCEANSDG